MSLQHSHPTHTHTHTLEARLRGVGMESRSRGPWCGGLKHTRHLCSVPLSIPVCSFQFFLYPVIQALWTRPVTSQMDLCVTQVSPMECLLAITGYAPGDGAPCGSRTRGKRIRHLLPFSSVSWLKPPSSSGKLSPFLAKRSPKLSSGCEPISVSSHYDGPGI